MTSSPALAFSITSPPHAARRHARRQADLALLRTLPRPRRWPRPIRVLFLIWSAGAVWLALAYAVARGFQALGL